MDKIFLIFGTSNTVGFWDWEGGGWADRLKRYLMERGAKNKGEYFVLYNLGIDGETTTGILARFEQEIKPRLWPGMGVVVILEVGVNDAILLHDKEFKTPPEKFADNLRSIIRTAKKYAEKVIFLDSVPFDEFKSAPAPWGGGILYYRNQNIKEYFNILEAIVREEGVLFLPLRQEFEKMNGGHLSNDGLHLNAEGHQKKFEIVKNFLLEHKII